MHTDLFHELLWADQIQRSRPRKRFGTGVDSDPDHKNALGRVSAPARDRFNRQGRLSGAARDGRMGGSSLKRWVADGRNADGRQKRRIGDRGRRRAGLLSPFFLINDLRRCFFRG